MRTIESYENPIHLWRKENHFTQLDLSQELGITRQVITNLERGLLSSLPTPISTYTNIPTQQYTDWVTAQRLRNQHYFRTPEVIHILSVSPIVEDRRNKNKWYAFKSAVNPSNSHRGFCRKLVYQPSLLTLYETKNQCKPSLIQALKEVGLSEYQIQNAGVVLPL